MRKFFIAALLLVCSPLLFAQPDLRHPSEREHSAVRGSEKTVLLRYDTATSAVGAVAETVSLDGVIDMNPVRALSGTYAVIVTGEGLSFVKPAPVMVRGASILVLVRSRRRGMCSPSPCTTFPPSEALHRRLRSRATCCCRRATSTSRTRSPPSGLTGITHG